MVFNLVPCPKPRMTQRDKWRKRDCVLRYRAFSDELRGLAGDWLVPESGAHVTFFMPLPLSYSRKKRAALMNQPHRAKPDIDNLEKAFLDALCEDDSYIWDLRKTKLWSEKGRIEVIY